MRFNTKEIRAALMAAGAEGFYSADIDGWDLKTIRNQVDKLRDKKLLFPFHHATLAGRTAKWFDTPEKAEAARQAYKAPRTERQKRRDRVKEAKAYKAPNMRQIVISRPRTHAPWPADAPARITSETIVTICPPLPQPTRSNTYSVF
jgi:hypothetical protein